MRALLDLTDAAFYLHMTVEALRELVKARKIPYTQRGKRIYFIIADLDAWSRSFTVVSVEEAQTQYQVPVKNSVHHSERDPKDPQESEGQSGPISLTRGRQRTLPMPSTSSQTR